jgi:hypothetical protein
MRQLPVRKGGIVDRAHGCAVVRSDYAAVRERIAGVACVLINDIPQAGEIVMRIVAKADCFSPARLGGIG